MVDFEPQNAAVELQKRADAAIQKLEAERARLQGTQMNLERNAVQAIHDAIGSRATTSSGKQ